MLKKNKQPVEPDGRTPAVDLDTCPFPDNSEDNNCNGSARYLHCDSSDIQRNLTDILRRHYLLILRAYNLP